MVTAQSYEAAFWGGCLNTYDEESKHYAYARCMGLKCDGRYGFSVDGATVIDIGGGPCSILLKTADAGRPSAVLDPLLSHFPEWVRDRYSYAGIKLLDGRGEDLYGAVPYDEAWIYNVLQHVHDPKLVIAKARQTAERVRVFEWVGVPAYEGHPNCLSIAQLSSWLGPGNYSTDWIDESGAVGDYFAGYTT